MSYWAGLVSGFAVYYIGIGIGWNYNLVIGVALLVGLVVYGVIWLVRFLLKEKYGEGIFEEDL